jgi:hypothetical protein
MRRRSGLARLRTIRRPHPATLIALLARVMAMGGTSVAASVINGSLLRSGSVSRAKIASGAIDSSRLAANAVTPAKIAKGAVTVNKLAAGSVTASALAPGSVSAAAIGPGSITGSLLATSSVSWSKLGAQFAVSAPVTLPVGTTTVIPATGTAVCPPGFAAISGGESVSDVTNAFVIQSAQLGAPGAAPTGWTATGGTGGSAPATMTVYAICINAA